MAQNSSTLFGTDTGAAGAVDYVKDALQDISLRATSNAGFSSTVSTNPLNNLYANDDSPRFGAKTLYVKDLVLIDDRTKWIDGKPTYQVIWNESFPQVVGYVYGSIQIIRRFGQVSVVLLRGALDGFGVGGVIRRAQFIVNGDTATTATAQVQVDGVAGSTIDFSTLASPQDTEGRGARLSGFVHAAANETRDIHDIRLVAQQAQTRRMVGVTVYFENAGGNIDCFPGTTYNNKTRANTTNGGTLPIPAMGSTLGGNVLIYKTSAAGYATSAVAATMVASVATGTGGAAILNVQTGHGASFPAGAGIVAASGTSMYVGVVQSVSTDALTVNPVLPFGISGAIYRYFMGGQSLAINATLSPLAYTFGSTEIIASGMTSIYNDPAGRFAIWGANIGVTTMEGNQMALAFAGASGFIQVEGYMSAADVEWFGMSFSVLSGTMTVNGLPVYSHANIGLTGVVKKTVFTEAGPGWNSFVFAPGASHTNVAISRVNMYRRGYDIGQSFGMLANLDILQGFVERSVSASFIAPGTHRRFFADQIPIRGTSAWIRGVTSGAAGGVQYLGVTNTGSVRFGYYGKEFAIHGFAASMNISIDGVSTSSAFNVIKSVATLGFHTVGITLLGPSTAISAIDVFAPYGELVSMQSFSAVEARVNARVPVSEIYVHTPTQAASFTRHVTWGTEVKNTGGDIIRTISSDSGDVFTVVSDGLYAVLCSMSGNGSALGVGIGRNSTRDASSITMSANERLAYADITSGFFAEASTIVWLSAGDKIKIHTNGTAPVLSAQSFFRMVRIA